MAVYVIADIHGCYSEFMTMLKKIEFDPSKDELIIAGDIIDRGPESYEMLRYMESDPKSVSFILGNHDYDFICYCRGIRHIIYSGFWQDLEDIYDCSLYNKYIPDKYGTVRYLLKKYKDLTIKDFEVWQQKFRQMPYFIEKTVNGKNYIIVHGGFITKENYNRIGFTLYKDYDLENIEMFYIWSRWYENMQYGGKPDTTIVFGHTPTVFPKEGFFNDGNVWTYTRQKDNCRFINIDCGLVYKKNFPDDINGKLACIRLDDEKIFYVEA
jgi:predicted phosphodiesterase